MGEDEDSRRLTVEYERRAYPRFKVTLSGLCSVAGGADVRCDVIDMSMGGAALEAEVDAPIGATVLVSLPQIGLIAGRVTRAFQGGFALAFNPSRPQRERVAAFLTWFVARQLDPGLEDRGYERIVPLRRIVSISVAGLPAVTARIVDVSRSGVALTTVARPAIGETLVVGATSAVVVRLFEGGFAARFVAPLDLDLDAAIIL